MVFEEYRLFTSHQAYYILPLGSKELLSIDRSSQNVRFEKDIAVIPPALDSLTIYGIWGSIRLLSGFYLLVITGRHRVGELFGHTVWEVTSSKVLPFVKSDIILSEIQVQDERVYCQMLESVLDTRGFYYSTTYDLTHTQQRLADSSPEFKSKSLFERCDPRFTWNRFLLNTWSDQLASASAHLSGQRQSDHSAAWDRFAYCLPVIQGFVGIIPNPGGTSTADSAGSVYALISRRSVNRVGTRFNSRGANRDGHCSNTVETEQLLELSRNRFSFVQVRGSVPLYWSQKPNLRYKPAVLLGGSQLSNISQLSADTGISIDEESLKAAQSAIARHHFSQLIYTYGYGRQVIINLLNQKGMERPLERAYTAATLDLDENEVKYESFDFHHECGSMRWERLSVLLERLLPELQRSKQFHLSLNEGRVLSRQTGTFRSNCIDCLDRTNVVQSMLAWAALELALTTLGGQLDLGSVVSTSAAASADSPLSRQWPAFGAKFRALWSDNADYCSLQYTGTKALKTDFTRTGKRTLRGMLMDGYHSLVRYYLNNFSDGFRQDAMHLFLGQYLVHDAAGTPKPLTGPGGRGRRGTGNADTEWRTQFLPLVFTFAMAMSVLCMAFPTAQWTEQFMYVLFWGSASTLSAFAIFAYGEEFVDRPRFCPD